MAPIDRILSRRAFLGAPDFTLTAAVVVLLAVPACASGGRNPRIGVNGPDPERRAIQEALRYLPGTVTCPITVLDPEAVPDSAAVSRLDAFIVAEPDASLRQRIYINRHSPMLREAMRGTEPYAQMLAAVIVHEARHLEGGTESEARDAESQFFARLIARGLVPKASGRRYLAALSRQGTDLVALPARVQ